MTEPLDTRSHELEEQLKEALAENDAMIAQAEDILLLARVAEAVIEADDDRLIFGKFLECASILKDLPYCGHFEDDGDGFVVRSEYAAFVETEEAGASLCLTAELRDAVIASDGDSFWEIPRECLTFSGGRFESTAILALPCEVRSRPLGLFVFVDDRRAAAELQALFPVLQEMVRIVQSRLENLALMAELSQMNRELERRVDERTAALVSTNRSLEEEIAEHRVTQTALRQAAAAFANTSEAIIVTDSEERILAVNPAFTELTGYEEDEVRGETPRILKSGRHDRAFYAAMWASVRETGRWKGEIWNRRKSGRTYPQLLNLSVVKDERGNVTHYIAVMSDLSAMKESKARFDHLAHFDPLTDLPNQLLFRARVEHAAAQARRLERRFAILVLGIDGFKHINESLGHTAGDELLRQLAQRTQDRAREGDTVAHLTGDEFVILLEGVNDSESAGLAARRAKEAFSTPFEVDGREVFLTCSAGISLFPGDGTDYATLLRNAEVALHRAKGSGGGGYQFSTSEMTEKAFERFVIESDLRRAIQRREFVLHYQPQYSLVTGRMSGLEALARWQHPERGLVSPNIFIPVAEETGLIEDLGAWAVREACRQAVAWKAEGFPAFRVAVNLSTRQLAAPSVTETVSFALTESGLAPELLELEITEGFLMDQPEENRKTLVGLKNLGVTLAIDDFGTGYSSLSYLKLFPVDKLKIDQSFVRDIPFRPHDEAIARTIITLGHGLGLTVVAEGVETEAQAVFLKEQLCDEVQGFLYGRPFPPTALGDFLRGDVAGAF